MAPGLLRGCTIGYDLDRFECLTIIVEAKADSSGPAPFCADVVAISPNKLAFPDWAGAIER